MFESVLGEPTPSLRKKKGSCGKTKGNLPIALIIRHDINLHARLGELFAALFELRQSTL